MANIVSKIKAALRSPVFWGVAGILTAAMFDAKKVNMTFLLGGLFLILVFEFSTSETLSQVRLRYRVPSIVACTAVLGFALWWFRRLLTKPSQDTEAAPSLLPDISGHTVAIAILVLTILVILLVQRRRYRVLEKEKSQLVCPDRRLHQLGIDDKSNIKNLVIVCAVRCQTVAEGRVPVHLNFTFSILNMSLYGISLDSTDGFISFHDSGDLYKPKLAPTLEANTVRDITFRRTGYFVIQQNFQTEGEQKYILESLPDSIFSLKSLKITVTGNGLDPTALDTDIWIKKDDIWFNRNRSESDFVPSGITAQIEELQGQLERLPANALPKLTFEIFEQHSQVHIEGGSEVRRISAQVKLRCLKTTDSQMAVRDFHLSLHKQEGPNAVVLVQQEAVKRVLTHPKMEPVPFDDGWTIDEPLTSYRWFMFYLEISPKDQALLSRDHFLRITMDVIGQELFWREFYVDNWRDAQGGNSSITLKKPTALAVRPGPAISS